MPYSIACFHKDSILDKYNQAFFALPENLVQIAKWLIFKHDVLTDRKKMHYSVKVK